MTRRERILPGAALVVAVAGAVTPSAALGPIDDFEIGSFSLQSTHHCLTDEVQLGSYPAHAFWMTREVALCSPGATESARLDAGTSFDDVVYYDCAPVTGTFLKFTYDWGFGADLTSGGTVDRIEIDLRQVPSGGHVVVEIADTTATHIHRAFRLAVGFESTGHDGDFVIADMRFARSGSRVVTITRDFLAIQVPPVPSPPLRFRAFESAAAPLCRADIAMADARTATGSVPAMRADLVEAPALGGELAGVLVRWQSPSNYVDTFFQLSVELASADGLVPELVHAPDPVHGEESILLDFPVIFRSATGAPSRESDVRMVFTVGGGQPLAFEEVQVTPEIPPAGSTPGGFRVSFWLRSGGNVDEGEPLFDVAWIQDWRPATATDVAATADPGRFAFQSAASSNALALSVRPNAMRSEAEIRANRVMDSGGFVLIHDVTGRLVRTLPLTAGTDGVHWNGCDDRGMPVTSGVYFAALEDRGERAVTRIVRTR